MKDRIKNRYKKPVLHLLEYVDQGIYVWFN